MSNKALLNQLNNLYNEALAIERLHETELTVDHMNRLVEIGQEIENLGRITGEGATNEQL